MDCTPPPHQPWGLSISLALMGLLLSLGLCAPALAAPPAQLGPAEPLYERGAHLLRKGEVQKAVPVLERAVELAPGDPDVLRLYVQALLVAGDGRAREQLDRLAEVAPKEPDFAVFLALANLRLGDWDRARTQLARAEAARLRSGTSQLLLGVAEQELGNFDAAREAYASALLLDPALEGQVAYRRGLLAMDEQRYQDALVDFRKADARLPGSPLAHSAASYAELLGELNPDPLELYLTAGFGYDSNITLVGDTRIFREEPSLGLAPTSSPSAGRGITEVGAAYRFGDARRNLRVGQVLYGTFNTAHTNFDQQISRTWLQGYMELGNLAALDVHYAFEFDWVDWGRFRRTHAVEPGLGVRIGAGVSSRIFVRYEDRHYYDSVDALFDRSGDVGHGGVDFFYALPRLWGGSPGWVRAGFRYRVEHADGDQFDSRGYQPVLTLSTALPAGFSLTVDARFEWRRYEERSLLGTESDKRRDRIANVTVGLERSLLKNVDLELIYGYTDDDSNVDFFTYDRHQVSLLATYLY